MPELKDWDTFCVIIGSSAAALIGLQFVAMTVIATKPKRLSAEAGGAFATPTVVHFCAVLLLTAIIRSPWKTVVPAAILWGIIGCGGVIYAAIVVYRLKAQNVYKPVFEDWLCYALLPAIAYLMLIVSAFSALMYEYESLFAVATSMLILLFNGIHNSWDNVSYQLFVQKPKAKKDDKQSGNDKTENNQ